MIKPPKNSKLTDLDAEITFRDYHQRGAMRFVPQTFLMILVSLFVSFLANGQSISVTGVSPSPVCAGSAVTVTFNVTNGTGVYFDNSSNYTLYLSDASGTNFAAQGSNFNVNSGSYSTNDGETITGLTYNFTIPTGATTGTGYQIALSSSAPVFDGSGGSGASPAFSINARPGLTSLQAVSGAVCDGSPATFQLTGVPPSTSLDINYNLGGDDYTVTATSAADGTVTFQTVNLALGNDGDDIYISSLVNNSSGCSKSFSPGVFYETITVNPLVTPQVSIVASLPAPATLTPSVCAGTAITFNATPSNQGTSPTYQWYLNGSPVGSSSTQYVLGSPAAGDIVRVDLTSNAGCLTTSGAQSNQITVAIKPPAPVAPGTISGNATICPSTSGAYSIAAVPNATSYTWSVPPGFTINSGQGTTSINITSSSAPLTGNISVTAANDCGTSAASDFSIDVLNPVAATPGSITGSLAVCPSASGTYSVTGVPFATSYNWTVPAGWAITSSAPYGNSINVATGAFGQDGSISVAAVNSCGVSSARTINVSVNPGTPAQPGAISGTTALCPGTGGSFSISSVTNASSYTWTVPTGWSVSSGQGTNSVTVTAGAYGQNGNISVTASNSCGTSTASIQAVTVNPGTPAQPSAITGTSTVCPGLTGQVYSVTNDPTATSYSWIVPTGWSITSGSGTNSIAVTTGSTGQNGNITVTATNSCGTSLSRTFAVTVANGTPGTPSAPTTSASYICSTGSGYVFTVASVANATSYQWNLPSGYTITSPAAPPYSNSVTVSTSGAASGNVTVQAVNGCGTSTASSPLAITIPTSAPATPGAITGISALCPQQTFVYSVPSVAGVIYNWTVPAGWIIESGQGTSSLTITFPPGSASGTLSVVASNGCLSSSAVNYAITVNNSFTLKAGDDLSVCSMASSQTVNISNANLGSFKNNELTWFILNSPAGWSTGPPNSINLPRTVTVPANPTPGVYTIYVKTNSNVNASACSGNATISDSVKVTVLATPTAAISGTTTICSGNSTNITFTGTANTTVTYKINGGADQTINIGSGGSATLSTGALTSTTTYTINKIAYQTLASCSTSVSGTATVTINPLATASAGSAQTICSGSTITLAGSFGGSATSATWSGGSGTYSPNNTTMNAVYTPSAAERAAGTVTLTLTTSGPCPAVTSQVTHIINQAATVSISPVSSPICQGGTFALNGSFGGGASSVTWSTNASGGSFGNASSTSTTYTPASTFYNSINFTLTTDDPAGPCPAVSTTVSAYVNQKATANAGTTQAVCSGSSITLAGSIGGSASSSTWSSSNGGSFGNVASLTSSYTPSISSGSVTLTLTTNDPDGSEPCTAVTSTVLITVDQASTVIAGGPNTVCQSSSPAALTLSGASYGGGASLATWSIISGGGSLSNMGATASPATVTYTPAAGYTGQVQLQIATNATGVCTAQTAIRTIDINQAATIDAGIDQTICSTGSAVMNASLGGSASSGAWSTAGTGTFNNNSTTATYTPSAADILAGNATLTYTSDDPVGPCNAVSDAMLVTIVKAPAITTQPTSLTVCASNAAVFSVQATGDNLSYQWYRGPVGGGSPIGGATGTSYTIPSAQTSDVGNYHVRISNPTCATISSNQVTLAVSVPIQITAQPAPATTICQGTNTSLSVTANANGDALSYQWYKGTPGSGTAVSNGGTISGATTNTLAFTSANPADGGTYYAVISGPAGYTCGTVTTNTAALTVNPTPDVTATPGSLTICSGSTTGIALTSSVSGTTFAWTASASGVNGASNGSGNNIGHTLTTSSQVQGTVTYTITPTAAGCAGPTATVTVTVNPQPTITVTPSATAICSGNAFNIALTSNVANTSFTWTVSASGVSGASDGNYTGTSGNITPTLTTTSPSTGTVTYTVSNNTPGGCFQSPTVITITVNPVPVVSINNKKPTMCSWANTDIDLTSNVSGATITWSAVSSDPANTQIIGGTSGTAITNQIKNNSLSPVTVTYTINASYAGCSVASPPTTAVVVNPLPTGSITAGVSGTATICLGNSTPITFTGNNGSQPYRFYYSYNAQSDSISTTSGNSVAMSVNPATTGNHTYTLYGVKDVNTNEASCPYQVPPGNAIITVKPLPTAALSVNNASICVNTGSSTVTFTGTGVAPFTFTYKVDGGSNQTINSTGTTATISVPNGTVGTKTYSLVSVAENGAVPSCSQPQTGSVAVTILPNASITLSTGNSTQSICVNNPVANIQYAIGQTGTGGNVTGLPSGVTGTYNAGVLTISGTPTQQGTFNYTATATGTCASATTTGTITVYGPPSGGTATNNSTLLLCSTANGGSISLSGQDGTINKWQTSTNGGLTWTDIASTANPYNFTNIGATTWFRAVVQKAGCNATQNAPSVHAVANVVVPGGAGSITGTANPAVICTGSSILRANLSSSYGGVGVLSGGEFDNAGSGLDGPGLWRKTLIANWHSGDKVNIEASTNNTLNSAFNLTNGPKTFLDSGGCTPITYNNNPLGGQVNNNKFMAVIGPNTSSLESPIFNLVGLTTASFDWWQAYDLKAGASIKVEISFDAGVTYNTTIANWTGPATYGSPTNFATASLNLNQWIGLSNLRIRFTYTGTTCSSWGLEKATITKGVPSSVYTWTMYQPAPAGGNPADHYLNQFTDTSVTATPPTPNLTNAPITYNYSISASAGACASNIAVTVNPVLFTSLNNPASNSSICSGGTMAAIPFTANVAGTSFSWTRSSNPNLTFAPNTTSGTGGSVSAATYTSITNNTSSPQSVTFTVTPTNNNACNPTPMATTITINPRLTVAISGSQVYCGSGVQTVILTSAGPFPINVTLSNGQAVTLTAATTNVTLSPQLSSSGNVTIASMSNISCHPTPTTGVATITISAGANLPVGYWAGGDGACAAPGSASPGRDWFNPCNWGGGVIPTNNINVVIDKANATCDPVIDPTTSYATANGPIALSRNITISGAINLSFNNGGQLNVAGNWTNNTGPAGFSANTGTVVFMGNSTNTPGCASQTVQTTNGNAETFYNLVINNTCNKDATGDNVVLNSPVNVSNVLTLTDGIVKTTSANILTVTNAATTAVVGGSNATYINGPLTRYTTAGGTYNFPIGNPAGPYGPYRPATTVNPNSSVPYTAEYLPTFAPEINNAKLDPLGILNSEYWDIKPTNGCISGDVAIIGLPYYNPGNSSHWAGTNPCGTCNVAIAKPAPDASNSWYFTNWPNQASGFNLSTPEALFNTNSGWIYSKPIDCTAFGTPHFTFGTGYSVVLPVKLLSFDGKMIREDAKLMWSITDNTELGGFELEHSIDGRQFSKLANIAPNGGNNFDYTDYKLLPGVHYYRLMMKDKSGNGIYSKTIRLMAGRDITVIKGLKATVVLGTGYVEIWSASTQKAKVQVYDMTGRLLDEQTGHLLQGDNSMPVRLLMLPQGIYNLLVITDDGVKRNLRLMKE